MWQVWSMLIDNTRLDCPQAILLRQAVCLKWPMLKLSQQYMADVMAMLACQQQDPGVPPDHGTCHLMLCPGVSSVNSRAHACLGVAKFSVVECIVCVQEISRTAKRTGQ